MLGRLVPAALAALVLAVAGCGGGGDEREDPVAQVPSQLQQQVRAAPVGFADIRLRFDIDAPDADDDQLATLLKLTERYCVVLQTLRQAPTVAATLERAGAPPTR